MCCELQICHQPFCFIYLWDLHTCDKNGNALLWLCSIYEEGSREILCLCWKVPYNVINLTLSNLGQSVCVPLAWARVRGRASPIRDETRKLFSVFVIDVVFKTWKCSFSLFLSFTYTPFYISPPQFLCPLYLFCASLSFLQVGSRSGRDEGELWLGQGLQHRTWELPLTPARVLCCSQWNCCSVHIRDHHALGTLPHLTVASCEIISHLIFFYSW